jgi:photosystem II stability/assembly factor-like uncharacterized protein
MGARRFKGILVLAVVALTAPLPAQSDRPAEIMPMAQHSLLLDVELAGDRAVAVGERGHILVSEDYGRSWRQVPSPTRATLTAVDFADPMHGWAVGHDNVILVTTDGGLSWNHQYPKGGPEIRYLDVHFLDARRGLAVGAYGVAAATDDGGETWVLDTIHEEELHLNRLSRGPDGRLYMAVEAGDLMLSVDNGQSWEAMDSPYEGSFFGVLPLAARTLLAHALRGHAFRSIDGGASWTPMEMPAPVLIADAVRLSTGPIVLAGQNEQFFLSHDGGRSFEMWRVPVQGASAVAECPDGALLATGLNGVHRLTPPRLKPSASAP